MKGLFAACAAVGLTAAFALPAPAVAAEKRADGVRNVEQMDVSAQRRYGRYGYRNYGYRNYGYRNYGPRYGYRHGYYRPYRSYYRAPYYAYAPQPYYRPYYRPGVSLGFGPLGFGFGF